MGDYNDAGFRRYPFQPPRASLFDRRAQISDTISIGSHCRIWLWIRSRQDCPIGPFLIANRKSDGGIGQFSLVRRCTYTAGSSCYVAFRASSIAAAIFSLPGVSLLSKRFRIVPSRPIRNLLKFQLMSPENSGFVEASVK